MSNPIGDLPEPTRATHTPDTAPVSSTRKEGERRIVLDLTGTRPRFEILAEDNPELLRQGFQKNLTPIFEELRHVEQLLADNKQSPDAYELTQIGLALKKIETQLKILDETKKRHPTLDKTYASTLKTLFYRFHMLKAAQQRENLTVSLNSLSEDLEKMSKNLSSAPNSDMGTHLSTLQDSLTKVVRQLTRSGKSIPGEQLLELELLIKRTLPVLIFDQNVNNSTIPSIASNPVLTSEHRQQIIEYLVSLFEGTSIVSVNAVDDLKHIPVPLRSAILNHPAFWNTLDTNPKKCDEDLFREAMNRYRAIATIATTHRESINSKLRTLSADVAAITAPVEKNESSFNVGDLNTLQKVGFAVRWKFSVLGAKFRELLRKKGTAQPLTGRGSQVEGNPLKKVNPQSIMTGMRELQTLSLASKDQEAYQEWAESARKEWDAARAIANRFGLIKDPRNREKNFLSENEQKALIVKMLSDSAFAEMIRKIQPVNGIYDPKKLAEIKKAANSIPDHMLDVLVIACREPVLKAVLMEHLGKRAFEKSIDIASNIVGEERLDAQQEFVEDCKNALNQSMVSEELKENYLRILADCLS